MCKVTLVEISWRNGLENKKYPETLFTGGVSTRTPTHRPYLDLDFRKSVTELRLDRGAPKNVTWQGGTKKRNLAGRHQKT